MKKNLPIRNVFFKTTKDGKHCNIKGGYYNLNQAIDANVEKKQMLADGYQCVTEKTWREKQMYLKAQY